MLTDEQKNNYFDNARAIINLYKNKADAQTIRTATSNLSTSPLAVAALTTHRIVLAAIQYPLVILKLLQAGIYMTTFFAKTRRGQDQIIISENVKQLFANNNLTGSDELFSEGIFVKTTPDNAAYNQGLTRTAKYIYDTFVTEWERGDVAQIKTAMGKIQELLKKLYQIDDLGVRALESAENSAWTTSALQLVTFVGCTEKIFMGTDQAAKCGAMQALYDNLLTRAVNVNL
jgi:hypothetical protein